MQWDMVSRTIKMNTDARNLIKIILGEYEGSEIINKLTKKFNKDNIVLNNEELDVLYSILVDSMDGLNESDNKFVDGFICNIT